jgi:hypothetical protein
MAKTIIGIILALVGGVIFMGYVPFIPIAYRFSIALIFLVIGLATIVSTLKDWLGIHNL